MTYNSNVREIGKSRISIIFIEKFDDHMSRIIKLYSSENAWHYNKLEKRWERMSLTVKKFEFILLKKHINI